MKINFIDNNQPKKDILVINIKDKDKLLTNASLINKQTHETLKKFLLQKADDEKSSEESKESIDVISAPCGLDDVSHILVVTMGKKTNFIELGGKIAASILALKKKTATLWLNEVNNKEMAEIAFGIGLRSWKFEKYLTKAEDKTKLEEVMIATEDSASAKNTFKEYDNLLQSINLARDVISEPGNVIHPESLPLVAKGLEKNGVAVEIYGKDELKKMGFNALLGVGQGSDKKSHLVVLKWMGASNKDETPVAIVGKGVTFDSGGISIKPSNKMEEMKEDMAGSAVVLGLIKALAMNKVKVNAIGVMGIVENMPSGSAQRPGDIVQSLSGQTIEVINTDAEGRLVLADALWYTQNRFKPKAMVDLATLTGAIVYALGYRYAGLFSNDESIIESIQKASKVTNEKVWNLPMDKEFAKALKADQADLKNSDYNVGAGSIMAAKFLESFVNKTPWAHLDIAGTAWSSKATPYFHKGATGFGIRLLYQWILDNYAD